MRCIPNLTIAAPRNEMELRNFMYTAQLPGKGPFVIRYPRGKGFNVNWHNEWRELTTGRGECLKTGTDLAVITIGTMAAVAEKAINSVENLTGKSIAHYDARFLKPLDEEMLREIGEKFTKVITIEDGTIEGGLGSAVLEFMSDINYHPEVLRIGIPDVFVEHGTPEELHAMLGMNAEGVEKKIKDMIDAKI